MTFIWPWMLVSLLLIPLLLGGYLWLYRSRQRSRPNLGPLGRVENTSGRALGWRRHLPAALFLFGLGLLFFGLSRPEMPVELPRVEGTVILAFDVSSSMAAEDLEPNRMEAAKTAAQAFIENQPGAIQLGVVAFSNGGLVVQPPTDDRAVLLETIQRLSPQGGTSLGQGIFSALNAIAGEAIPIDPASLEEGAPVPDIGDFSSAVILLLTDGENTASPDPLEIAQLAAQANVRIYPVGIGSADGTVLEIDGFNVLTQLNETTLQEIASVTNGEYYQAADEEALREIYQNVDLKLAVGAEKMEVTALLAGLSVLFFLVGGAFSLAWFGRLPI